MTLFLADLAEHAFLQQALIGAILASVACGLIGPFVVVRQLGYAAGGIAHSVLWGMGAALLLGGEPMHGAIAAALVGAFVIGGINAIAQEQEDTLISALWSTGMAGGIILLSLVPEYQGNLMGYLFGNILMIRAQDIRLILVLDIALLALIALFYKQLVAATFDEEFAYLRGVPTTALYLALLCMVALTVVAVIQLVGMILLVALITLPAAIAAQNVGTIARMIGLASGLGILFTTSGLALSYESDWPTGPTIIMVTAAAYFAATLLRGLRERGQKRRAAR